MTETLEINKQLALVEQSNVIINTTDVLNILVERIDDLLKNYENKAILIKNVIAPFMRSLSGDKNVFLNPVYIYGNPGVGKTTFVEKFAKTIGTMVFVKIIRVSFW